jgi:hypothetical protein
MRHPGPSASSRRPVPLDLSDPDLADPGVPGTVVSGRR